MVGSVLSAAAVTAYADSITLYEDNNFRGRPFTVERPVTNFDRDGLNDRFRSAVVHDGRWEICLDADFHGSCSTLAPGAYPDLGAYAGRISSARPTDSSHGSNRYAERSRNRDARATLYEGPNLSGRSYALNDTMQNLGRTGFNARASSLRVESGYWIFCSDADFQGNCHTYGPGDYPNLPSGQSHSISSGRQVSNNYPYRNSPRWNGN